LLRWLALTDSEALELEHGEDIDLLTGLIAADADKQERLLEQVKRHSGRVTLRSAGARAALANFHEHQVTNPRLALRFRYTTTARVTRERKSPMPGRLPGIHAWSGLQRGDFGVSQLSTMLAGVRVLLRHDDAPEDIQAESWARYQGWVQQTNDEQLLAFVTRFEWAVAAPDESSLVSSIIAGLRAIGAAPSEPAAVRLYERLFRNLFERLSKPGLKRLTRADLAAELSEPVGDDDQLLRRLHAMHRALTSRVAELEIAVGTITGDLSATMSAVQALTARESASAVRMPIVRDEASRSLLAPTTAPPPVQKGSSRAVTVREMLRNTSRPLVVALYGGQSSGKTQLAARIADAAGPRCFWLRLARESPALASQRLVQAVIALSDEAAKRGSVAGVPPAMREWEDRCRAAAQGLDVIVLDDMPAFSASEGFADRLRVLIENVHAKGVSVVMTSELPPAIAIDGAVVRLVPPLSVQEIAEIFVAYGAPSSIIDSGVPRLSQGLVSGHPQLGSAIAAFLARREWAIDNTDIIQGLLASHYATPINDSTVRVLLERVTDDATRDLLYRLTIPDAEFDVGDVEALANVAPPIDRRRERFVTVVGPWVQQVVEGRYALSPLVRALGAKDLGNETRRACHRVVGERILARERIGNLEAMQAVRHLAVGEAPDSAALLILHVLYSLYIADGPAGVGATRRWRRVIAPPQASAHLRLQIHAFQAVLALRDVGAKHADVAKSLGAMEDILVGDPPVPAWAIFSAAIVAVVSFALDDVAVALRFLRPALSHWDDLPDEIRSTFPVQRGSDALGIEVVVWLCGGGIRSGHDLLAWLSAVRTLPSTVRVAAASSDVGRRFALGMANSVFLHEDDRAEQSRDWSGAVAQLESAEDIARELGIVSLAASCRATQIACLLAARASSERVERVAEDGMAQFGGDSAFLVAQHAGQGYLDASDETRALKWFLRASAQDGVGHVAARVRVEYRLTQLLVRETPAAALAHAAHAVALVTPQSEGRAADRAAGPEPMPPASSTEEMEDRLFAPDPLLRARATGEYAIALWLTGDRRAAAATWLVTMERVFACRADDDEEWQALFVRCGHVSGYFATMLSAGHAPDRADGEAYLPPELGMVANPSIAVAARFAPAQVLVLGVPLMILAEAIDDDASATSWAERSVEALKAAGLWTAAVVPGRRLARLAIERGNFALAIDLATDALTAFWLARGNRDALAVFTPSEAPTDASRGLSEDEQHGLGAMLLDHVVLPSFARAASVYLENPRSGEVLAKSLIDACRAEAEDDDIRASFWLAAADVCEFAIVKGKSAAEQLELTRNARESEALRTIGALGYLGASLDASTLPRMALELHLALVEYIFAKMTSDPDAYRTLVLPFFMKYWIETFNRKRFLFRAPALVQSQLEALPTVPPALRLQQLMHVLCFGLEYPLTGRIAAWVSSGKV
jgi:hypothetical protein